MSTPAPRHTLFRVRGQGRGGNVPLARVQRQGQSVVAAMAGLKPPTGVHPQSLRSRLLGLYLGFRQRSGRSRTWESYLADTSG